MSQGEQRRRPVWGSSLGVGRSLRTTGWPGGEHRQQQDPEVKDRDSLQAERKFTSVNY